MCSDGEYYYHDSESKEDPRHEGMGGSGFGKDRSDGGRYDGGARTGQDRYGDGERQGGASSRVEDTQMDAWLVEIGLGDLRSLFREEKIRFEILSELGHEELKEVGVSAYGDRHRLIKEIKIKIKKLYEEYLLFQAIIDREFGIGTRRIAPPILPKSKVPCPFENAAQLREYFNSDHTVVMALRALRTRDCDGFKSFYRRVALRYHPDKLQGEEGWQNCPKSLSHHVMAEFNQKYDSTCRQRARV